MVMTTLKYDFGIFVDNLVSLLYYRPWLTFCHCIVGKDAKTYFKVVTTTVSISSKLPSPTVVLLAALTQSWAKPSVTSVGNVSLLSYGPWLTFGHLIVEKDAKIILQSCCDHGVNFFDTSESYSGVVGCAS
ncbi:hypothetical protein L1987_33521 [Smallanthus sonchifolius]|uniref:Uncharacterized protein n=1 Tax=Smallanthus sonchifolius TaxID=185202 RepID=A0ACB9HSM4_9ASTR|nr:hypothetical protein L1987_33521 [Smallanthus sonchifolius]